MDSRNDSIHIAIFIMLMLMLMLMLVFVSCVGIDRFHKGRLYSSG